MIGSSRHRRGTARALLAAALAVSTLGVTTTARAQSTQPTAAVTAPVTSAYSGAEIRRSVEQDPSASTTAAANETGESDSKPSPGLDTARVVVSLGVVLVLIFGLKLFGQKWFAPGSVKSSNRTVETLSRATIGPKQQVVLVRVGKRRVLVIGDSGGKLSALDQITDANEIAELVGHLQTEKLGPTAANAFAGLFGKNAEKFAAAESEPPDVVDKDMVDSSVSSTQRDLESLLSKVRRVSGKMGS